ncbi:UNVERIFIED_ORG: hypothetical protein ABIC48_005415 [Burkholderia territorii]
MASTILLRRAMRHGFYALHETPAGVDAPARADLTDTQE